MNCKNVNIRILSFLDGDLNDADRNSMQNHIDSCDHCKIKLQEIESIYSTIEVEKSNVQINPYMAQKVWSRVQSNKTNVVDISVPIRRLAITTLVAAGLTFGIAIGSLVNNTFFDVSISSTEQMWSQLSDDYFSSEVFSPYDELDIND